MAAIVGTTGNVGITYATQQFGGRIRRWALRIRTQINDATGFSSSGDEQNELGVRSLEFSCDATMTKGTADDQPLGDAQITGALIAFVFTADSGCTISFSGRVGDETQVVDVADNGRYSFDGRASGGYTIAWVTT